MRHPIIAALMVAIICGTSIAPAKRQDRTTAPADRPPVADLLESGRLAEAETTMSAALAGRPDDDQARFSLGVVQFLRGVERLGQSLYQMGLKPGDREMDIPFLRLPVADNPNPRVVTYDDTRNVLAQFIDDVAKAEATLAGIKAANVKLPLRVGMIRLDLNGDGKAAENESLWQILASVRGGNNANLEAAAKEFTIAFDAGDVQWLRGYCHLLQALGNVALAYDGQEIFERTAHLFFKKVQSPYPFLQNGKRVFEIGGEVDAADLIALIHLIRMPVKEPQRMTAALEHLQAMAKSSRESWKLILAETDNDREWIPNPRQQTVVPNLRVTQEMVDGWLAFLDEFDALLAGKALIPFWRAAGDGRGVNLRKVFTDPRPLDLILWVQGTAAAPYLEQGPLTRPEVWRNLVGVFEGDILTYAAWFN